VLDTVNLAALVLALLAAVAIFRFKAGVLPVLAVCASAGALYALLVG
jgi:chromate transporter